MPDVSQMKLGWNPDTPKMMAAMPNLADYQVDKEFAELMAKVPVKNSYSAAVTKQGKYGMRCNDKYGCCTISNAANDIQTKSANAAHMLVVPDALVKSQYFGMTGGKDTGLYSDVVYKNWLSKGFFMSDDRYSDKLLAFAIVDPLNDDLIRFASYFFGALSYGVSLPNTAKYQMDKGLPWDYIAKPTAAQGSNEPASWGGHQIHVPDFTDLGETCVTWGELQPMTKAFRKKYVDFASVTIDLNFFNAVHKIPTMGLAYKDLVADIQKYLKAGV